MYIYNLHVLHEQTTELINKTFAQNIFFHNVGSSFCNSLCTCYPSNLTYGPLWAHTCTARWRTQRVKTHRIVCWRSYWLPCTSLTKLGLKEIQKQDTCYLGKLGFQFIHICIAIDSIMHLKIYAKDSFILIWYF